MPFYFKFDTLIAAQRMLQRMFLPIDHFLCRILLQQSSCFLVDGLYLIIHFLVRSH